MSHDNILLYCKWKKCVYDDDDEDDDITIWYADNIIMAIMILIINSLMSYLRPCL